MGDSDQRARGAKFALGKMTIKVLSPTILRVGTWATSLLVIVVPLAALVMLLFFIAWFGWHKFSIFRKKLKRSSRGESVSP